MYYFWIWSWNSHTSLLQVFSSWGMFSLEGDLFELGLKVCLVFFQKAHPNPFPLPLFFQTWAFHVSYCCLMCSLLPQLLALLSAVLSLLVTPFMWSSCCRLDSHLGSFLLLLRLEYRPVGRWGKEEKKMMGFVLFGFGFEKVIKRHNELLFVYCSVTFWTSIFIRRRKQKHTCTTGS